jgi:hypothetical protein
MSIAQQYLESDESYQGSGVPRYKLDGRIGGFARYDKDGQEQDRVTSIEGVVSRISIQEFTSTFDQTEKVELEVDVKSKALGPIRIVANLLSFTGLALGEGVALAAHTDDLVLNISTKVADKKNSSGGNIIYVNVAELTSNGWSTCRPEWTGDDKGSRLVAIEEELSAHPLWKVRVYTKESEHSGGPFGVVLQALADKNWPMFEVADAEYMKLFNKATGAAVHDPNEYTGEQCQAIVAAISKAAKVPKAIEDAAAAMAKAIEAPKADEFDPFADE